MKHEEFVKQLNTIGFTPCGSNGCLAHIPCEWLTLENFKAAVKRHQVWLNEQGVDIDKMLKPGAESEGWCVLWANDGSNAGCGTFLLPKYWLGNPAIRDLSAPPMLRGYKLAFEFFRFVAGNIKLSCRSMYPSPYERLYVLGKYLGLGAAQGAVDPTLPGYVRTANKSMSPVKIGSADRGSFYAGAFEVDDYTRMGAWLLNVLQNPEENFKDFVLLAPAFL